MKIWEALQLDMERHRCAALVGGGGKTTLMYALARQARDAGRSPSPQRQSPRRRSPG